MTLNDIHSILFNAHILFSVALGIWGLMMALRDESITGNFWGAVATGALLAATTMFFGIIMTIQGLRPERITVYYLYMSWLIIIMPGLFTMLRGRDDRSAAIAFAILSFFNATTSLSMVDRNIIGPWIAG
ncbi:MAG: hypothetical protein D6737_13075 [Chloroflexi bacterium]|nr:MAG: hypothetical protein CUN54_07060 [Phototrophicales bacterium]RMF78957.1 MAG: hypothetical protein D6737_13075 [Chloroflexota bacterium]